MTRLDDYQSAMLIAYPDLTDASLGDVLVASGPELVSFIIDHGLGALWHERTGREEFHPSRLAAEALFLAQENALREIDTVLGDAGVEYAVIKGAATRLLLYQNPAVRACHDLDLLVRPDDRLRTAFALISAGFTATPIARNISRELVLSRGAVDIDLHWGLLREGRLRQDRTAEMLIRRRRSSDIWMLDADDALFVLLVHPAFAKHLAGREMGLHRVLDIVEWLRSQAFDWPAVRVRLEQNGVRTAAWATLRWVELLTRGSDVPLPMVRRSGVLSRTDSCRGAHGCARATPPRFLTDLDKMMLDLSPGRLRRAWLNLWLRNDLSARMSSARWTRLLGFSLFLHDTPRDALRALAGRRRAFRRSSADLAVFRDLPG